jgi:hypothetical protein
MLSFERCAHRSGKLARAKETESANQKHTTVKMQQPQTTIHHTNNSNSNNNNNNTSAFTYETPSIKSIGPVVVGIVWKDKKFLVQQRPATSRSFPNLWEFPGGFSFISFYMIYF